MGADARQTREQLVDALVEEFRAVYHADARNAAAQSFDQYWDWVKVFLLKGGAGQRGWLEQGESVLRGVGDAAVAQQLRDRVGSLGSTIAAEWAKDSRRRRIHSTMLQGSPNLYDWGRRLQRAADRDGGDGAAISEAIDAIERDVRAALG